MNFAQVVETSVTITDNSPFKDYIHPDDQTTLLKLGLFLNQFQTRLSLSSNLFLSRIGVIFER